MEYSTYCLQRNTEYTIWLILTITDQSYHRSKLDTSRGSVLLFASLRLDEGTSMRLTYPHLDHLFFPLSVLGSLQPPNPSSECSSACRIKCSPRVSVGTGSRRRKAQILPGCYFPAYHIAAFVFLPPNDPPRLGAGDEEAVFKLRVRAEASALTYPCHPLLLIVIEVMMIPLVILLIHILQCTIFY
jgi:hypothetical protein